jgi:hypothetical protein
MNVKNKLQTKCTLNAFYETLHILPLIICINHMYLHLYSYVYQYKTFYIFIYYPEYISIKLMIVTSSEIEMDLKGYLVLYIIYEFSVL